MRLSHGTSLELLDEILNKGLLPRNITNVAGNFAEYPSGEDRVYLTNSYSPYFAMMQGKPLLIEVEVDEEELYPDEDFLAQATNNVESTLDFRDSIVDYKHHAMDSLQHLGTVAYLGSIEPEQIVSAWTFEGHMIAVCDPSISIINYRFLGEYYRQLTDWFLGSNAIPESPWSHMIDWFKENAGKRKNVYTR